MRRFLLALVMSSSAALAQAAPADAPRFTDSDVHRVHQGELVPYDGLLYSDNAAIVTERGLRTCEADRDNCKSDAAATVAPRTMILIAAGVALAALAGGIAIGLSLPHHP